MVTGGDQEDQRGRIHQLGPGSRLPLLHPGSWVSPAGVKDIWEDRVPGARGLCRETHGIEVVAACCYLPRTCECQPGMFPALLSVSSAGPASQAARGYVTQGSRVRPCDLISQGCDKKKSVGAPV